MLHLVDDQRGLGISRFKAVTIAHQFNADEQPLPSDITDQSVAILKFAQPRQKTFADLSTFPSRLFDPVSWHSVCH